MKVVVLPRGSEAGSDHFFVVHPNGQVATICRVDPDGTLFSWVPDRDDRVASGQMLRWSERRGAAYTVEASA